jgi:hypothetical protein
MIDRPQLPELPSSGGPPPPPSAADDGLAPHRGTLILVLGIFSWVTGCFVLGVIAWAMGNRDLLEMEEGRMDPAGQGTTSAGRITGMVQVILSCVGFLVGIAVMVLIGLYVQTAGE